MPSPANNPQIIDLDLAIIGGGAAGLWLLNRAQTAGYQCALFEHKALGSDQTIASQGMIHGGMKYTLSGALSGASEAIAGMPGYWRACLKGTGDVDLRNTRLLSDHFYLWSSESASSRLATFLASKLIRGRVDPVAKNQYPELLRHKAFRGSLYRIGDLVLDVPSLLSNLAQAVHEQLFLIDWSQAQLYLTPAGQVELSIRQNGANLLVRARRFIFSAGKGSAEMLSKLGLTNPEMQLRPLHQVMVKHNFPEGFYGHCLGADTTPRLTISSHTAADGKQVWYLGGSLAEKGIAQSATEVIASARQELASLMPWLDLSGAEWASLPVARAEQRQGNFARPDNAFVGRAEGANNLLVAWPTKLTLVPNLAQQLFAQLAEDKINPAGVGTELELLRQYLPTPAIAQAPWDLAFPSANMIETGLSTTAPDSGSTGVAHEA
jgi:glycerol-3-phosphate dehydrogenase